MTPQQLLVQARRLASDLAPYAALSSAVLARRALEHALRDYWLARAPGVQAASFTAQLICLAELLGDPARARRAAYAWGALSHACHHPECGLGPEGGNLEGWITEVEGVVALAA